MICPVAVRYAVAVTWPIAFAIPKSATFACPSAVSSTFSGLRSRWTIPCAAASASPPSTLSSTPATCASVNRPTSGRSEPRSRYSMAMNGTPSCSKYSITETMLGWLSPPATRDSCRKRCASAASATWTECSSLSATSRPSAGCRARCTEAIPPAAQQSLDLVAADRSWRHAPLDACGPGFFRRALRRMDARGGTYRKWATT